MPATAADWFDTFLRALGAVAGGLVTLAAAIYGVQRTLKRDRRDDHDATLLGRAKTTIFEQYEGVITRLEADVERQRLQLERLMNDHAIMREMMTQANRRILELELEKKVAREEYAKVLAALRSLKRGEVAPEDVNTQIFEQHLHS